MQKHRRGRKSRKKEEGKLCGFPRGTWNWKIVGGGRCVAGEEGDRRDEGLGGEKKKGREDPAVGTMAKGCDWTAGLSKDYRQRGNPSRGCEITSSSLSPSLSLCACARVLKSSHERRRGNPLPLQLLRNSKPTIYLFFHKVEGESGFEQKNHEGKGLQSFSLPVQTTLFV